MQHLSENRLLAKHERAWAEQELARVTLELKQTRAELDKAREELRQLKQESIRTSRETFLLEVEGLTVSFDGFKAINNLSVYVSKDELYAIIGPNGAGKSTLLDTICGKIRSVSGSIMFKDYDLTKFKEYQIVRMGVGRKFQTPSIYEELTVLENLETSYPEKRNVMGSLFWKRKKEIMDKMKNMAVVIFLEDQLYNKAGTLSHGQKQWLEIGMLLLQDHELLLLDEPVAGMSPSEREKTAQLLKKICKNRSVIVIEHDMNFVEKIADRVTVLHHGKWLSEGSMEHVKNDPKVIEVYVGHC
jgi:urea transport system ATP-binding protein